MNATFSLFLLLPCSIHYTFHLFNFDCVLTSVCLVLAHPHTKPSTENGIVNCNLHLNAVKSITFFLPFCSFDLVNIFCSHSGQLMVYFSKSIIFLVKLLLRMNCNLGSPTCNFFLVVSVGHISYAKSVCLLSEN